jgi:hypothetical protein
MPILPALAEPNYEQITNTHKTKPGETSREDHWQETRSGAYEHPDENEHAKCDGQHDPRSRPFVAVFWNPVL